MRLLHAFVLILFISSISSSQNLTENNKQGFKLDYEKYVLENGLEVVLHEDHSDPIVAVATVVHVGSARELPGRTGFAHFFEHMSFNDSENVPRGANRKMIPEFGGLRNGGTWNDGTIYYEVVPTDAFEKILWIDSDRLGFMINTVTKEALEREKQVVKNEKRERVDNQPYGFTEEIIKANLYPKDHPYSWTVIGSLPDLQAASLSDVTEFYNQYYGPNNATLVIAGDIDIERTKELVNQWFGEIRRGPEVENVIPMPVQLSETKSLYYEDNFAKLPELTIVFPSVENYNQDGYALKMLAEILSGSKKSPLYKVIVEEKKLAPEVNISQDGNELAGEFTLTVRANAGVDLDEVYKAINEGFSLFERDGFDENELVRIKAKQERSLYEGISTILDKAFQLCNSNEYAGDPGYVVKESKIIQAITHQDILDVYNRYIKNKNYVMTSIVPKGQLELRIGNSVKAEVWQEEIKQEVAEEEVTQGEEAVYEKTVAKHDRSEPDFGEAPLFKMPEVWTAELSNGLKVNGILQSEVPLVTFNLTLRGGHLLDSFEKAGVANLVAEMMMQGTKSKTAAELEEAIGLLGSDIDITAGREDITITANTLAKNFKATLQLVSEILLEPRWDVNEFNRLKQELKTNLKGEEANPVRVGFNVFYKLLFGENHINGIPTNGTLSSVKNIELEDLKEYYSNFFVPSAASFSLVGDIGKERVVEGLTSFENKWFKKEIVFPEYGIKFHNQGNKVYFIDFKDAKQSFIVMGKLTLKGNDDDYNNLSYANQILGGGSSGRLFQTLRIEKGYTYGAYAVIPQMMGVSPFVAYTNVRTNITLESLQIIKEIVENYKATFTENEKEVTKNKVLKDNTRRFESYEAKLSILNNISKFALTENYIEREQNELMSLKLADYHRVIEEYLNANQMIYIVVGNAETQLQRIKDLGYGEPIILDIWGNEIKN